MATDRVSLPHVRGLDGLRGLALIAILLYHSDHLIGGFISVDMFFALSGFLITSLLLTEWRNSGTISLSTFWARRARRLLPALGFLLVGIAAYAAVFAAPSDLDRLRGDALATIFYFANWHAIFAHESYFATFTPSPLRHAWTLAVEEQFYLLWPMAFALIILVWKHVTPKAILVTAVIGAAASGLIMAVVYDAADPNRAYYGTDSRAYAVFAGIGAAAFVAQWGHARRRRSRAGLEVLAVVAIAFIIVVWNRFEAQSPGMYRGGFFLTGLAMVFLLLAVANPIRGPLNWLLSFPGLVLLGTISYGVYLWHWPINLVLDPVRTGIDGWPLFALRTTVAIAFGTFSYILIEQPVRRGAGSTGLWRVATPVLAGALVLVLLGTTAGGAPARAVDADPQLYSYSVAALRERRDLMDSVIPGSVPRVLLTGDSVALTLGGGKPPRASDPFVIANVAMLGCGLAQGVPVGLAGVAPESTCEQWPGIWRRAIRMFRPRAILLLVGTWEAQPRLVDGQTLRPGSAGLRRHLERRLELARSIAAQAGIPLVMLTPPCLTKGTQPTQEIWSSTSASAIAWYARLATRFGRRHPRSTRVIDLARYICPSEHARTTIGDAVLRPDGVHFSEPGARAVWRWLAPRVRDAVRSAPPRAASLGASPG